MCLAESFEAQIADTFSSAWQLKSGVVWFNETSSLEDLKIRDTPTRQNDKTEKGHKYYNTQLRAMILLERSFGTLLSRYMLFYDVLFVLKRDALCIFNFPRAALALIIKLHDFKRVKISDILAVNTVTC